MICIFSFYGKEHILSAGGRALYFAQPRTSAILTRTDSIISCLARLHCRRLFALTKWHVNSLLCTVKVLPCPKPETRKYTRIWRSLIDCLKIPDDVLGVPTQLLPVLYEEHHIGSLTEEITSPECIRLENETQIINLVSLWRKWYKSYWGLHLKCWFDSPSRGSFEHCAVHRRIWLPAYKPTR